MRNPGARRANRTPMGLLAGAMVLLAGGGGALAQNVSNEAWLGQVGGSNVLDIVQEGRGNSAGQDSVSLLLGQDGVGNTLSLLQTGYDNKLGTLFGDQPTYARGVQQHGDRNRITIEQISLEPDGSNRVGAVQQYSGVNLPGGSQAYNSLSIIQNATGNATEIADHYVGRIVQRNTTPEGATNSVEVVQIGGGMGLGNVLANLRQVGSGNSFSLEQSGQLNRIGEIPAAGELPVGGVVQRGHDNAAEVRQDGVGNLLEYVEQWGRKNSTLVLMTGDQNVISRVVQNNESWLTAAVGNRMAVTISGKGNGGDFGIVGDMLLAPALATEGVLPSLIQQLGDDNDVTLTVIDGVDNKHGLSQFGDGNEIVVTIASLVPGGTATANETAIFQDGDMNVARHRVQGDGNAGAISQRGHGNVLELEQSGESNSGEVRIVGHDNNGVGATLFGSALTLGLEKGQVTQLGDGNLTSIDVLGSKNAFAVSQTGQSNQVAAKITGGFNALAVLQNGNGETSLSVQAGTGNSLAVQQF